MNRIRSHCSVTAVFGLALLVASAPRADAVVITDSDAFYSGLSVPFYAEQFADLTYDSYVAGTWSRTDPAATKGYTWQASSPTGVFSVDKGMSTSLWTDPLIITFTGNAVYAVGGEFYSTDRPGNRQSGQTLTIRTSDNQTSLVNGSGFVGFTSLDPLIPFTSIMIQPNSDGLDHSGNPDFGNYASVTNFTVGAVPEPVFTSALVPVCGLLLRRRKR